MWQLLRDFGCLLGCGMIRLLIVKINRQSIQSNSCSKFPGQHWAVKNYYLSVRRFLELNWLGKLSSVENRRKRIANRKSCQWTIVNLGEEGIWLLVSIMFTDKVYFQKALRKDNYNPRGKWVPIIIISK